MCGFVNVLAFFQMSEFYNLVKAKRPSIYVQSRELIKVLSMPYSNCGLL